MSGGLRKLDAQAVAQFEVVLFDIQHGSAVILVGALERGLGVFRVVDEIVGGAGALLWSWLLFLILLLIWSGK